MNLMFDNTLTEECARFFFHSLCPDLNLQDGGAHTALELPNLFPVHPVGVGDKDVGGSLIPWPCEGGPLWGHASAESEDKL